MADVALVTPLRDGMNLVSKEYIASKVDGNGVLVLSEMAGAARELAEAIIINPNDIWHFAETIYTALTMPEEEQRRRMTAMQQTVSHFDIHNWVRNFMNKLEGAKASQVNLSTRIITPALHQKMTLRYHYALKRLLLIDYDGTLVPYFNKINDAKPDEELLRLLRNLTNDPHNKVVIISGRDYKTLDAWLGHLPLDIVAEHGAWYKDYGKMWRNRNDLNDNWKEEIRNMMNLFNSRTPGASIEEKSFSLAWHYRNVEAGFGELRANELKADISHFVAYRGLQLLQGDKVIEVKSMAVNKGKAARRWLEHDSYDFIIAIGDDHTDEDMFKVMPEDAITVKVGGQISAATYYLNTYEEVRSLLQEFSKSVTIIREEDKEMKETG
jgi:trehalose 6-phosphate synthase/phosphatase